MIRVPDLIAQALNDSPALSHAVRHTFDRFEPWLEQSGMPFFPGFTDHSPRHINDVLQTAASLISDNSRSLLSAEDAAVFCMSVLLHDCAMHLTQDSFRALIQQNRLVTPGLGDQPWPLLWKEFLSDASRFGEEKLIAIFGSTEPYRTDLLQLENVSDRDCMFVGEFVRLHHTRIAHEVAVIGVPTSSASSLQLIGFDKDFCDIAGLIARSHGRSIRSTFDYLRTHYAPLPEYRRIKIPYLMAVLRIADYIQVHRERAIDSLLSVKTIRSPVSRQEWQAHLAVKNVSMRHEDPEALYVSALPPDLRAFLKLERLFKDIQRELDDSWATLGEVYGRQRELARLGLAVRRIRSNLESPDTLAQCVPYLPIEARLSSAGSSLLKLLIKPLYGEDHSTAIRELVQNSVDACRELADLLAQRGIRPSDADEADVLVKICEAEDGTGSVTVTDRGIGMTRETVIQYFLVAGASFRSSDLWKRQHIGENGSPRPLRGGRFGIGVLTGFLLGDEINVVTRHVTCPEDHALEFTVRMDDPIVELRRCSAPIGTTIRIAVSDPDVIATLRPEADDWYLSDTANYRLKEWFAVDWFRQLQPRVEHEWNGYHQRLSERHNNAARRVAKFQHDANSLVPMPEAPGTEWNALVDPRPYEAILWRYEEDDRYLITVNGIRIVESHRIIDRSQSIDFSEAQESQDSIDYMLNRPSMAIFDTAGICPINLDRSDVSFDRMETENRLKQTLLRRHVRSVIQLATNFEDIIGLKDVCEGLIHLNDVTYMKEIAPFCLVRAGFTLASPRVFATLGIKSIIFLEAKTGMPALRRSALREDEALLLRVPSWQKKSYWDWFRTFWARATNQERFSCLSVGFPNAKVTAAAAIMCNSNWQMVTNRKVVAKSIYEPLRFEKFGRNHRLLWFGESIDLGDLGSRVKELNGLLGGSMEISACTIDANSTAKNAASALVDAWVDVVGGYCLKKNNVTSSSV